MGLTTVKHIALAVEVFQQGQGHSQSLAGFSMDSLQQHSLLVGEVASGFFSDKQTKEDAFVVGLLHDIGRLLLAVELPEQMAKVLLEMKNTGCSMTIAEERIWGVTHAEVGGYLLGLWGLPYTVIEAVANHHLPTRVDSVEFGLLAAAHIADALVHDEVDDRSSAGKFAGFDIAYLENLGVADKVEGWREIVRRLTHTHGGTNT